MSDLPAVATATSAAVSVHGLLFVLTGAIEDITLSAWPRTWPQWGTPPSAERLATAVAAALIGTARLAGRLGVSLWSPLVAPVRDRSDALRLMYAELTPVVNVVTYWKAQGGTPLSVTVDRLNALVSAILAVADQHNVLPDVADAVPASEHKCLTAKWIVSTASDGWSA
jgi:hypothetical protein